MNVGESRRRSGWVLSLAFWLCLVLAAGLFAAAALAPKLADYARLKHEHYCNQLRLVTVERRVRNLQAACDALKNDPAFAREMARTDFNAGRPGEERLPVDRSLSLSPRPVEAAGTAAPAVSPPWYLPVLEATTDQAAARAALFVSAAVLVLAAFTFLHESATGSTRAGSQPGTSSGLSLGAVRQWLAARYRRPTDDN